MASLNMLSLLRPAILSLFVIGVSAITVSGCGYSDISCGPGELCDCHGLGSCDAECVGGACDMHCDGTGSCDFDCPEGGCFATCEGRGSCAMSCPGGDCTMTCKGYGSCALLDCDETCELNCRVAGTCERSTSEEYYADDDEE